jgi:TolA-binding protein
VRGDIKLSQANLEGAALDYLRSAILFESEKETLPEALFKAADALEKLRDPRAKELYRRVASEFGGTPWAQKAAGK